MGCMMPWLLMLSANSYSEPSSMRVRGWYRPALQQFQLASVLGAPVAGGGRVADLGAQQGFQAQAQAFLFLGDHAGDCPRGPAPGEVEPGIR
jgi:hypothetical protein